MLRVCVFLLAAYLCGLFLNASLILIVLMTWPVTAVPFWFRLILAAAPLYFLLVGLFLRKDRRELTPGRALAAAGVLWGLLMVPAAVLAAVMPDSVLGWFLFPVSGDAAAALGSLEVWSPWHSFLGAAGAPLLFWAGTLLTPIFYPEKKK